MQIFRDLHAWRQFRQTLAPEQSLGFIPTMGNLHLGHVSLFKTCQEENDRTVVSIFVNPTQFNDKHDFVNYPRTLDTDLQLLSETGVDYCLLPQEDSIYADGKHFQLIENKHSLMMEGKQRPGHFTGVLTIVN